MILLMQLHVVCNVVLGCMETRSVHDATAAVRVSELGVQRGLSASVSELLWRLLRGVFGVLRQTRLRLCLVELR